MCFNAHMVLVFANFVVACVMRPYWLTLLLRKAVLCMIKTCFRVLRGSNHGGACKETGLSVVTVKFCKPAGDYQSWNNSEIIIIHELIHRCRNYYDLLFFLSLLIPTAVQLYSYSLKRFLQLYGTTSRVYSWVHDPEQTTTSTTAVLDLVVHVVHVP